MIRKTLAIFLLVLLLAACGGGDEKEADPGAVTLDDDYADAVPVVQQLSIGTMLLEGTDEAVTQEQAGELLTAWQMMGALQESGTAAEAEVDAVLDQIQTAMTEEQIAAIKEMKLTPNSLMEMAAQRGGMAGLGGMGGQGGGFRLPAGVAMPGGGAGGGLGRGGGLGGGADASPDEREAAMRERLNSVAGSFMTNALVQLLQARAEGQELPLPGVERGFGNVRSALDVLSQFTGLQTQELVALFRDGKTVAEVAAENGADLDEIANAIVQAETERIEQAVADGNLDQASADELLANLEAQVKELLEQPLQFGNRGLFGGGSDQP
jgi:hypothetical protein